MHFVDFTNNLTAVHANLALDEALLEWSEARSGAAILRVWELAHLAVVLGASCRIHDDVHLDQCRRDGVAIARRSSGGGTVLIGPGALNVAVVLPIDSEPSLSTVGRAQRHVMSRLAEGLRTIADGVELLGSGDLAIGGRKFAGSAQRRLRHSVLVHASILHNFNLALTARYLPIPRRQPEYRQGRRHEDFLMNLGSSRGILAEAIVRSWPGKHEPFDAGNHLSGRIVALVSSKLGRPEWVERF